VKKLYLEFVRGTAALIVLMYHFIEMHPVGAGPKHHYLSNWGTDAVIIFFILSGLVINISQTHNPKSRREFIANRLLRIYPQLAAGIALGLAVMYVTWAAMPSITTVLGNLLMISALKDYMNNIVPCIESNSPIWSLSYEMFFYLMFALVIGRFQKKAIVAWFLISLAVMPLYYSSLSTGAWGYIFGVIAFSSIWLAGYFAYEYRNYFYADKYAALFSVGALPLISRMHLSANYYDPVKYLLFAVFAVPFFRYCLQIPAKGKKINLYYMVLPYMAILYIVFEQPYITFTNFVLYGGLPIGLMAAGYAITVLKLKERVTDFINNTGNLLGKYSYSIYISHYPVLFFCAAVFHNVLLYALVSLPCVFLISYSLENYLQPAAVNLFKKHKKQHVSTPQFAWFLRWARV
jgi:peptidoglycan/LPS O-acetylase OafA/YrhL